MARRKFVGLYFQENSISAKNNPLFALTAIMNKYDPDERFINNFGRRLKGTGSKVDTDPLLTRCALLDNCFCTKNADCGADQSCTTLPGYAYRVYKTKNEVPDFC